VYIVSILDVAVDDEERKWLSSGRGLHRRGHHSCRQAKGAGEKERIESEKEERDGGREDGEKLMARLLKGKKKSQISTALTTRLAVHKDPHLQ